MSGNPRERVILAIDTSDPSRAEALAKVAQGVGARRVKLGLELSSKTSWAYCSELAATFGLDWVADAKIKDIPNTVTNTVKNIITQKHPPIGVTMHIDSGREAMRMAQVEAGEIIMLGVSVLTSLSDEEVRHIYGVPAKVKVLEFAKDAVVAGLLGIVASPLEVKMLKDDPATSQLYTMIPGTRSEGVETQDQVRVGTPGQAIRDGADLLVIGRQVTGDVEPAVAFAALLQEIQGALK